MDPIRSLLLQPADEPEKVVEAPSKYDADAYSFSLEGMRSGYDLSESREVMKNAIREFDNVESVIAARLSSTEIPKDIDDLVHPNLDAVVTEGVESPEEISTIDRLLSKREAELGIEDPIEIVAIPETAQAIYNWYDVCMASDRITAVGGGDAPGGDIHCEIRYEWTPSGEESFYIRQKQIFESRLANVEQVLHGVWVEPDDLDGLRDRAKQSRQLGATGYMAVDPSQIEPINEIFTPDPETVAHHRKLVETVDNAVEEKDGRTQLNGEYVYDKKRRYSEYILDRARAFGVID
jgi:citrate lyase subunit beta/citryl-CoA lyase